MLASDNSHLLEMTAELRLAGLGMSDLMKRRADAQDHIDALEAQWLETTEALRQRKPDQPSLAAGVSSCSSVPSVRPHCACRR